MRRLRIIPMVLGATVAIIGVASMLPPESRTTPAGAVQQPFDHSNCQYPDRWSNPVDGCDNSDPAVPECIKAFSTKEGEDACIANFIESNKIDQAPATETVTPAQPKEAAQCGGK